MHDRKQRKKLACIAALVLFGFGLQAQGADPVVLPEAQVIDKPAPAERLRQPILEKRIAPVIGDGRHRAGRLFLSRRGCHERHAAPRTDPRYTALGRSRDAAVDRRPSDRRSAGGRAECQRRAPHGRTHGHEANYLVRGFLQQTQIKDGFRAGDFATTGVFTFEGPTDVANLERIEVLKGPSAILYGRGEPGGVVNYITREPVFENRFSFQQQASAFQEQSHGALLCTSGLP